jgi:hypothetical protein
MFANKPEMAREFADHTPKGAKLPEHVKKAYTLGEAAALDKLGLKYAAEELRLKIPDRTFHGYEAATKSERAHSHKRAEAHDSNDLIKMLESMDAPISPTTQLSTRDHLDRQTSWGAASNLSAGDTANRLSDMGQSTAVGAVF